MKRPVRCPNGTLYDAAVHAECPCPSCWADRSSATLAVKGEKKSPEVLPQSDSGLERATDARIVATITPTEKKKTSAKSSFQPRQKFKKRTTAIGLGAIVLLAIGAFHGTKLWIQNRVEREVEATFSILRADFATASHGTIELALWDRTITINDVVLRTNSLPPPSITIAKLALTGANTNSLDQFSARQIEITNAQLKYGNNTARIGNLKLEHLDLRPSKLPLNELVAVIEAASNSSKAPSSNELNDIFEKIATGFQGIILGNFEMRGMEISPPNGLALSYLYFNKLYNGRVAEVGFAGLEARSPQSAFSSINSRMTVRRVAINNFDVLNVFRKIGQLKNLAQSPTPPTPAQVLELLPLVESIALDDFITPDTKPGQVIHLKSAAASWSKFAGTVPSTMRISAQTVMPISRGDKEPFKALAETGQSSMPIHIDVGGTWTESNRIYVIAPLVIELGGLFSASMTLPIANVPPTIFTADRESLALAAGVLEAGTIEFLFRDLGIVAMQTEQSAKAQALSAEAVRKTIISNMSRNFRLKSQTGPSTESAINAFAQFLENPGASLKIKLISKGRVNVVQTLEALKTDPLGALLSRFDIRAIVTQ